MPTIKITVMRQTVYTDLMEQYENPMEHACDLAVGQTFLVEDMERPAGLCESAWESMTPFVKELLDAHGAEYGVTSTVGKGSTFYFILPITE